MPAQTTNGIVVGVVVSLEDPEGLGRVRVRYPYLGDQESQWARMVTPMAGAERGFYFLPEPEDEVLVAFEQGDVRRPYILGGLWSTADMPPPISGEAAQNNQRLIRSRSGHQIILGDADGEEKIEIIGKNEERKIVIDSANGKIQIIGEAGDIEISASSGQVKVEGTSVEITASEGMTLEATGTLTIKGATVDINP